jgi:hypothetical protein
MVFVAITAWAGDVSATATSVHKADKTSVNLDMSFSFQRQVGVLHAGLNIPPEPTRKVAGQFLCLHQIISKKAVKVNKFFFFFVLEERGGEQGELTVPLSSASTVPTPSPCFPFNARWECSTLA